MVYLGMVRMKSEKMKFLVLLLKKIPYLVFKLDKLGLKQVNNHFRVSIRVLLKVT